MQIQSDSPIIAANVRAAIDQIGETIDNTPGVADTDKAKVKQAIDAMTYRASVPNTFVYRIAVSALAAAAALIVVGALILAFRAGETPEFLQVTLATIVGALAGMIVPTSKAGL